MEAFRIDISPEGLVRVSIGGVAVGLIEQVYLVAAANKPPKVKVKFVSLRELPDEEAKAHLIETLHRYYDIVRECPWTEVHEQSDTLPQMVAVKPEV